MRLVAMTAAVFVALLVFATNMKAIDCSSIVRYAMKPFVSTVKSMGIILSEKWETINFLSSEKPTLIFL